jgi:hypothetical protein
MRRSFLLIAATYLIGPCSHVAAFSSPTPDNNKNNNQNKAAAPPPPPPPRQTPDERQAAMLQKMGYTWNGKAWVRGDAKAYQEQRAVARSANRFIRFVDSKNQPASSPSALAATKRLNDVLENARLEVLPRNSQDLARDRDFKNFCQRKSAPFVWLGAEVLAFLILSQVSLPPVLKLPAYGGDGGTSIIAVDWTAEWQHLLNQPLEIAGLGIVAGIILSTCRATSRQMLPGVEEPDGKLVRVLSDAMDGNFALPAPNHVRYASRNWKLLCTLGETIAAVNISVLMNGLFQPLWIGLLALLSDGSTSGMFMDATVGVPIAESRLDSPLIYLLLAAVGVALPAALRALQGSRSPWDGIPAECQAVMRAKQTAGAYYNMNPPEKCRGAESSLEATRALESLVDGWTEKFVGNYDDFDDDDVEHADETTIVWKQPLLAWIGSLACAMAWQLSGGSLAAPFLARVIAAGDTYLLRDEQESCRAGVLLL